MIALQLTPQPLHAPGASACSSPQANAAAVTASLVFLPQLPPLAQREVLAALPSAAQINDPALPFQQPAVSQNNAQQLPLPLSLPAADGTALLRATLPLSNFLPVLDTLPPEAASRATTSLPRLAGREGEATIRTSYNLPPNEGLRLGKPPWQHAAPASATKINDPALPLEQLAVSQSTAQQLSLPLSLPAAYGEALSRATLPLSNRLSVLDTLPPEAAARATTTLPGLTGREATIRTSHNLPLNESLRLDKPPWQHAPPAQPSAVPLNPQAPLSLTPQSAASFTLPQLATRSAVTRREQIDPLTLPPRSDAVGLRSRPGSELAAGELHFTQTVPTGILVTRGIGESIVLGIEQTTVASRINPAPLEAAQVRMTEAVARDLGLHDGEIVRGVVRPDGEALKLLINGIPLALPEGHALRDGETQSFRVLLTAGELILQPLRMSATTAEAAVPPPPLPQALAPAGLNTLASLLLNPQQLPALMQALSGGFLDRALRTLGAADRVLTKPSMARLNALSLRKAVADTGLWTEASLAHGKTPAQPNLKTILLRLARDSSGDTADIAARALVDIEAAQLQAVQAQSNNQLLLNLLIPFADVNPVRVSFYRPAPSKEQPDPPYTVDLHSHNDALGEIWLKTVITGKTQVDMTMWAPQPAVATAATRGSRSLRLAMERAGLRMNSFQVYNSARQEPHPAGALPGTILNVRA